MSVATVPDLPIHSASAARQLFAALAHAPQEVAAIAYLDRHGRLLGLRHIVGGHDRSVLTPRMVVADALAFGAEAAVIAHNHPSGCAEPSTADRLATRALAGALAAVEVRLHDSLIVTANETTSFRALGLL